MPSIQLPLLSTLLLLLLSLQVGSTQEEALTYEGQTVVKATSTSVELRLGGEWMYDWWSIAPEVANDTLSIVCYDKAEGFAFRTDQDQLDFKLQPGQIERFYVLLPDGAYAHTIIQGMPFQTEAIAHNQQQPPSIPVAYQQTESDYLQLLQSNFPLDFLRPEMSDQEKVLAVLHWTHQRWEHNGNQSPLKADAISILREAEAGGQFPCFAYAIVLRDQLSALGYAARTVFLKTKDAATRIGSPGHVATEVFLVDKNKWVFVDAQFNVMPSLQGIPLNAAEFQQAISNEYTNFELLSLDPELISKRNYVDFVYDYLYYFDTSLDHRYGPDLKALVPGKTAMMLVPLGAENLTHIDFWDMEIDYCIYTHAWQDFYAFPK